MSATKNHARNQLVELLQGRPGWRLEPRTTPGASPVWCFVSNGSIECSVTAEGDSVRLVVADSGTGIRPAALAHVFDPFFTTKEAGTGLGLSIVRKIVDQHGGKIAVESDPGKGCVFRVFLPMERAVPAPSK